MAKKAASGPRLAASAETLFGYVFLDQGDAVGFGFSPAESMSWHPSVDGVVHRLDGSSEPVTVTRTARPKKLTVGKEVFQMMTRATSDDAADSILFVSLENDGAPVELWCSEVIERIARRKKKSVKKLMSDLPALWATLTSAGRGARSLTSRGRATG